MVQTLVELLKKYPKQIDAAILIFGFILGANFFIFLKMSGLDEANKEMMFGQHGYHFLTPSVAGFSIGVILYLLEFSFFSRLKGHTRKWIFLIRFGIVTLVIISSTIVIQTTVNMLMYYDSFRCALEGSLNLIGTEIFFSVFLYMILLWIALNFFRELGNRFGHGIIINYLSGKYREPVEEDRTFMFIDLNSSTSIAELLGHVKYSRLINKCFNLLTELISKYDAELYQYVGDEAALTWNNNSSDNNSAPIMLFFEFEKVLLSNKPEFEKKFGCFPTFKAAINSGKVIVSEIGGPSRKELAYHGDVLNTCARLLELNKTYKHNLFATSNFLDQSMNNGHLANFLTKIKLRGKSEEIAVFSIHESK